MRKKISVIFAAAMAIVCACAVNLTNNIKAEASAAAEIAMELQTGKVLEEGNADSKMPMASTTKIMTAIIVIEDCDLNEVITVADSAVGVEGSSIYLQKGEKLSVRDLLYGLMLRSGNDSAAALAIHHSGSIEKFVEEMNARAKKLGVNDTQFKNPSGLPAEGHYTTARNLCEIARYAMQNQTFREIVSTKNYTGEYRSFVNKNKMLATCEGANGVKTGYTVKAGRCLVSSAERNGMDVVCVVLNCPEMYERSRNIIDGCFNKYELVKLDENSVFMSGKVLCKLPKTYYFVAKKGQNLNYKVVPVSPQKEFKSGAIVARLEISGENGLLFSENLFSIV